MNLQICPYCNGLKALEIACPSCNNIMRDAGTLQEALGPYSPYEENSLIHQQFGCVHRLFCDTCNSEYMFTVSY